MIAAWVAVVICLSVVTLIFLLLLIITLLLPLLVVMVVPLYREVVKAADHGRRVCAVGHQINIELAIKRDKSSNILTLNIELRKSWESQVRRYQGSTDHE